MALTNNDKEEWYNIIEHYAYRTENKCVKLDHINQLLGGNYDWHPVIGVKTAKYIFDRFVGHSKRIERHEYFNMKVENIHALDFNEDESKQYRVHIFNRGCTDKNQKAMWIFTGIFLKLPNDLGYVRVFYMPCKFIKCTNYFLLGRKICTLV